MPQDGPGTAQHGPKTAFRRPPEGLGEAHKGPLGPQENSENQAGGGNIPPRAILGAQDGPEMAQGDQDSSPGPLRDPPGSVLGTHLGSKTSPTRTPNCFQHAPIGKTMIHNFFQCSPTVFNRLGNSPPAVSHRTPVRRTEALLIGWDHLASNNGHTFLLFLSAGLGTLTTFQGSLFHSPIRLA